ncbi:hypothetical protein sos41_03930 [Alphaproteobacteria bacterium SO-S41]|nr:hypothetical protein sos41_03930 [Alphaproteobacteria bacterium SO-S41]
MIITRRTLMATLTASVFAPAAGLFRAVAAPVSGAVTAVVNTVRARKSGAPADADPVPVAVGDTVEVGQTVETSKQSAVQVTMSDGSVATVGARSMGVVGGPGTEALIMARGNFRYNTGSGPEVNRTVSTPALKIALKGTQIIVSVDETRTICGVIDGAITCTSKKTGASAEVAAGQTIVWGAGSFGAGATAGVYTTGDVAVDQGIAAAAEAWKPAPVQPQAPPPRPRPQPPRPKPGRN